MILSGRAILDEVRASRISIDPFDETRLNPNSYNLALGPTLSVYVPDGWEPRPFYDGVRFPALTLDCREKAEVFQFSIPKTGFLLHPGKLYLGATVETTATEHFVPMIEGRSSLARLGLSVHQTGGFGDLGFRGTWTLEFACVEPIRIYAGMEVAQVQFWEITGPLTPYDGKYVGQRGPTPSMLYTEMEHDKSNT